MAGKQCEVWGKTSSRHKPRNPALRLPTLLTHAGDLALRNTLVSFKRRMGSRTKHWKCHPEFHNCHVGLEFVTDFKAIPQLRPLAPSPLKHVGKVSWTTRGRVFRGLGVGVCLVGRGLLGSHEALSEVPLFPSRLSLGPHICSKALGIRPVALQMEYDPCEMAA